MTTKTESSGVRVLFLLIFVGIPLILLLHLCTGCALTNLSSAERRAGTYAPETGIDIDYTGRKIKINSSGDDDIEIAKMETPNGVKLEGFKAKFNRSKVVKAQGERGQLITPLMGQDIEANQIWSDTTLGVVNSLTGLAGSIAPQYFQAKQSQLIADYNREAYRLNILRDMYNKQTTATPQPATEIPIND